MGDHLIKAHVFRYLLSGNVSDIEVPPNPTTWIDDFEWPAMYKNFYGLDTLDDAFNGIFDHFLNNVESYKAYYETPEAHLAELPAPWHEKLNGF